MEHHKVVQGTPEWDALRLNHLCSSEAPIIMGASKHMKRDELLEAKATCTPKEFSSFLVDVIFEEGHETEAAAREILGEYLSVEFFPVTGSNGLFLASYDGMTMDEKLGFEHKQWNKELAAMVAKGVLPDAIRYQLEQQLMVCDSLNAIVFVVSDGTTDNFEQLTYASDTKFRNRLVAGWQQFQKDLESFEYVEKKVEKTGTGPKALPVLNVQVFGELTTETNLQEFRARSVEMIEGIKSKLETDQDFKDAEVTVKYLKDAEAKLELTKKQSLSKAVPLENLFTTLDEVSELMKVTRIRLDKQVAADKKNRRNSLVEKGADSIAKHMVETNGEFIPRKISVNIAGPNLWESIKGMSSFDNMAAAISDDVARFKVEVNMVADRIRESLKIIDTTAADYPFLLTDMQTLVELEPDYLQMLLDRRIADYKEEAQAAEQKKIAACKAVIEGFKVAAEPPDHLTLAQLEMAKSVALHTSTEELGDYKDEADQEKFNALAALTKAIAEKVAELEQAEQVAEEQSQPEPEAKTEMPIPADELHQHDDALPGHDDLDVESENPFVDQCKKTEAINVVLLGSRIGTGSHRNSDGLVYHTNIHKTPTGARMTAWMTTLSDALKS